MNYPISYQHTLWSGEITSAIQDAATEARDYGLALVKSRTPVLTGEMQAGWQGIVTNNGIEWLNTSGHSGYVEYGTRYQNPQYILTNSLDTIEKVFITELATRVGRQLALMLTQELG